MSLRCGLVVLWLVAVSVAAGADTSVVIVDSPRHLRSGEAREWDEFPQAPGGRELVVTFPSQPNGRESTLRLRQRDVKQVWHVRLNGRELGLLTQDEATIVNYFAVPAGALRAGDNELRVTPDPAGPDAAPDDVEVGEATLIDRPRPEAAGEAVLSVEVADGGSGQLIPARVTVADEEGARVAMGTVSRAGLAVRPGVAYTGDGRAELRLPAGRYTVYAGRGFEYSLASAQVELGPGARAEKRLEIRRVVPTDGWAACDTHVHTLTYSRHGDALVEERVVTLAGEGIELPVATEHNLQVDLSSAAEKAGVRRYFTPVIGNEVTTPALGHFNVFPIDAGAKLINWRGRDWDALAKAFAAVPNEPAVVLNHARDTHGGFRPFDPTRHVAVAGEQLGGPAAPANAMEVINSGATMNDPLRLIYDWFGMLNAGHQLTPVGSSDSHDVARYIVGQGRTYIRCDDADPGNIDLARAVRSFREGRVLVSYGLLADVKVNGRYGPGDLARAAGDLDVEVSVLGPEWTKATRLTLFANGLEARAWELPAPGAADAAAGVKWRGRFTMPRPKHDLHLVAVATGPGISAPYWPTAKPYQPTSSHWESYVLGITGAVRVDADGSGAFDCARDYAARVVKAVGEDPSALARALGDYDEAVSVQAASLLRGRNGPGFKSLADRIIEAGGPAVRAGFTAYLRDLR